MGVYTAMETGLVVAQSPLGSEGSIPSTPTKNWAYGRVWNLRVVVSH